MKQNLDLSDGAADEPGHEAGNRSWNASKKKSREAIHLRHGE